MSNQHGQQRVSGCPAGEPRRAFTVLEVLIATAILSVIMLVLFNIFNMASSTWINGEAVIYRNSSARLALDMINREMSQAVITTNTAASLYTNCVRFVGTPTGVYFTIPIPPAWGYASDLAQVGYHFSSPPALAGVPTGVTNMIRSYTEPTTANAASGTWNPRHNGITATNGMVVVGLTNLFATANVLADHVQMFTFAYYDASGTYYANWDSARGVGQSNTLPSVVEATMVILDDRIGSRFNSQVDTVRARQLLQSGRTNVTVIHLINAP